MDDELRRMFIATAESKKRDGDTEWNEKIDALIFYLKLWYGDPDAKKPVGILHANTAGANDA